MSKTIRLGIDFEYVKYNGRNKEEVEKFVGPLGRVSEYKKTNHFSEFNCLCIVTEWHYDYRPEVQPGDYVAKPSFGPGIFVFLKEDFETRIIR